MLLPGSSPGLVARSGRRQPSAGNSRGAGATALRALPTEKMMSDGCTRRGLLLGLLGTAAVAPLADSPAAFADPPRDASSALSTAAASSSSPASAASAASVSAPSPSPSGLSEPYTGIQDGLPHPAINSYLESSSGMSGASRITALDDAMLTDEAVRRLMLEEEERRKRRKKSQGRLRELEEIRIELAEKELALLEKEKALLAKEQTLAVLTEELEVERKLRALLTKEKERAEEEAALAMGLCMGGFSMP
ncbi:hypothetical protein HYH03_010581 [Edaphochlamys debaryana]|uniref:Uncharacterized protein n=1 Tax=Edaphochlamys debaryana TaxID=47281 RepID=A0A836BXG2_9CHLO|nr:hypothetical protein HYH03_010581 [Edaphochlamys debaryana]|eukprot:KAG2491139.1 hypothetical protein HYH03_010581 [Edaphochlamys debaryana]